MPAQPTYYAAELLQLAFGINSPIMFPYNLEVKREGVGDFASPNNPKGNAGIVYETAEDVSEQNSSIRLSQYGLPVMYPMQFLEGNYKKFSLSGELVEVELPTFDLPATTMVDFSRPKRITETEQNAGVPVDEMYGFGHWDIKIRGLCLKDKAHPQATSAQQQKEILLQWEEVAGGIYVAGSLFTERNISFITIRNASFQQMDKRPHITQFSLDCKSAVPPEEQIL